MSKKTIISIAVTSVLILSVFAGGLGVATFFATRNPDAVSYNIPADTGNSELKKTWSTDVSQTKKQLAPKIDLLKQDVKNTVGSDTVKTAKKSAADALKKAETLVKDKFSALVKAKTTGK